MKTIICMSLTCMILCLGGCSHEPGSEGEITTSHVDTGVDSRTWARVPAGEFVRGQHQEETMVDYDFEIMATQVTNSQYAAYLDAAYAAGDIKVVDDGVMGYYPGDEFHGYNHEFEVPEGDKLHMPLDKPGGRINFESDRFEVSEGFENHPVTMITWFGAWAYCEFYRWRLPTEIEWEKAARSPDGRTYPWGDEIALNQANFYSTRHAFAKAFGEFVNTTPAGYFGGEEIDGYQTADGRSPYGLYDMAGNVWQWCGDDYPDMHLRYMRGGSYSNYEYNLRVWARNSAAPDYYGVNVGFRCARGGGVQVHPRDGGHSH